jgi:hypothetical protein
MMFEARRQAFSIRVSGSKGAGSSPNLQLHRYFVLNPAL